jgi:hypothetical protein
MEVFPNGIHAGGVDPIYMPATCQPQGFHLLVMLVAGGKIRDTQCGFKVGQSTHRGGNIWVLLVP